MRITYRKLPPMGQGSGMGLEQELGNDTGAVRERHMTSIPKASDASEPYVPMLDRSKLSTSSLARQVAVLYFRTEHAVEYSAAKALRNAPPAVQRLQSALCVAAQAYPRLGEFEAAVRDSSLPEQVRGALDGVSASAVRASLEMTYKYRPTMRVLESYVSSRR